MTRREEILVPGETGRGGAPLRAGRVRDPRLDFFRGMTMFIILIAHVPNNWLALWIPARFGFSDATEVFVFCSGMASAIAFGRVFRERGLAMGTARIGYRVWQVYWAHIGLFLAVTASMVALDASGLFEQDYTGQLNLHVFFTNAEAAILGLLTLTYVPNYFDILPMYLVVLAMLPVVMALARLSRWAVFGFVSLVWLGAHAAGWHLPAEPWSDREWFFNPFGWQLVFFTGFAFMSRWLPAPPLDRRLMIIAGIVLLLTVPFAYYRIIDVSPAIAQWRQDWMDLIDKTDFGILRYLHFLALAYLAWIAVGPKGSRLQPPLGDGWQARVWRRLLGVIMTVGQQSLAVFIGSMFLAQLLGVVFDQVGRSLVSTVWVNLLGFALVVGVAYGSQWFKSQPWRTGGVPAND
jgi:hypothetical protein